AAAAAPVPPLGRLSLRDVLRRAG
ncbi:MAG: hypothetical protein JWR86_3089, partial [Enterovirga sp.]|nr:hypothetical protein [Enterovirga sp.]